MAMIKILEYPDKKLSRVSVPVETFDQNIQTIIDDMFETKYNTPNCAALAATQLDLPIPYRITVIDLSQDNTQPLCLVNGQIIERDGEQNELEGCMSVHPNHIHEKVKRAMNITVKAQDRHGNPLEFKAEGYLAKCIQHELDHLDGYLYLDRINKLKVERINRKVKKILRMKKNEGP